ncbi:MAG: sulfatase [Verrucomicrobiota bacterium]
MKRIFLFLLLAALVSLGHAAEKPNLVIFLADDLSLLDTSVGGSRDIRTPNMERLARAGMTFTHAFVASPTCAPSRAALLTGRYPVRNGSEANHSKARADVEKLPARFRQLGYEVAAFGKVAHYGHGEAYSLDGIQFESFHDHRGIPAAVNFLAHRDTTKPLCLFVGTNWPHRPWPQNAEYDAAALSLPATQVDTPRTRDWRTRYATAVTKCDDDLGTIYDAALARLGANTLFLFSSDHGAQWPFGKWTLYDAGIHVPAIIAWPGVVKPDTRTDAMVSWIDFLPTLLEAAGDELPPGLDGRSFLAVLRDGKKEHRDRIFTTHSSDGSMNVYPCRGVRSRDWKYILNLHPEFQFTSHVDRAKNADETDYFRSWEAAAQTDANAAAIVRRYHQHPREELYDLQADPFEMNNLAADPSHAGRLATFRQEVEDWMREQGDEGKVFGTPVFSGNR